MSKSPLKRLLGVTRCDQSDDCGKTSRDQATLPLSKKTTETESHKKTEMRRQTNREEWEWEGKEWMTWRESN